MNNRVFASEPFIQLWCMISAGRIDTVLDDLNGMALRLPLRHRAPALIFVCQQWHAISSRGTGTKTQVLILSALMVLMARRMSETACHWKCNAAYGMTSRNDSRNTMFNEISRCTAVSTGERTGAGWVLPLIHESIQRAGPGNVSISASRVRMHIHNRLNKNIQKRCKNKETSSKKPEATLPSRVALVPWIQMHTNAEIWTKVDEKNIRNTACPQDLPLLWRGKNKIKIWHCD